MWENKSRGKRDQENLQVTLVRFQSHRLWSSSTSSTTLSSRKTALRNCGSWLSKWAHGTPTTTGDTYVLSVSVSLLIVLQVLALWQTCRPNFFFYLITFMNLSKDSGPAQAALLPPNPTALDTDWPCLHWPGQAETLSASVSKDASALCLNCFWDVCVLHGSMLLYRGSLCKQHVLKLLYAQENFWQSVLLFSQGYYKPE